MLGTLEVDRTDYALPNAADDAPRNKNELRHGRERSWVEERRFFD